MEAVQHPPLRESASVHIRWMIRRDTAEVLAIEESSFGKPWAEKDIVHCLRQRNCIGQVAEISDKVVAYFIYELHNEHLTLINLAVHPDYRNQGIAHKCIAKLQSKLSSERRSKIIVLLPESCKKMASFFEKYGDIQIRLTEIKGKVTYKPVFKAITKQDVAEAQEIEDEFMNGYSREPRDIATMISHNTRYGIVARDQFDGDLLGYVLYSREASGIDVNGEFGIIVKPNCRRQGIGRKLMMELVNQKLPVTISDIYLFCKIQVAFLKAMGVPVPPPQERVTVKWLP